MTKLRTIVDLEDLLPPDGMAHTTRFRPLETSWVNLDYALDALRRRGLPWIANGLLRNGTYYVAVDVDGYTGIARAFGVALKKAEQAWNEANKPKPKPKPKPAR